MTESDAHSTPQPTPPGDSFPTTDGSIRGAGETEFQQILDQVPYLMFSRDLQGRFRMVNRALAECLGSTTKALLGSGLPIGPEKEAAEQVERILEDDREIIAEGKPRWVAENRVPNPEGDERILQTIKIPYTIANTNEPAVFGMAVDITDLKRAQEALRQSEERLHSLFENSPVSLWEEDHSDVQAWFTEKRAEGVVNFAAYFESHPEAIRECTSLINVMDVNRATLELCQARNKQELLDNVQQCFEAPARRVFREMLIVLSEGGLQMASEMQMRTLRGEPRTIQMSMQVAPGAKDSLARILFSVTDLTLQRRSEEERRRLEEQIRHAQKLESLGILAGGVAHDFNNLLSVVLGFNELARRSMDDRERALQHLDEVEHAAQRAASLAGQMLAYSGHSVLLLRRIDLNALSEEIARLLEVTISKKAALTMRLDPDLPAVAGDRSQLQQVLMNLISNASDALEENNGHIEVITESIEVGREYLDQCQVGASLPPAAYARLTVTDSGCGMDAETQRQIFDPFFTTKFTGRGLGLAVTQGIVKGHKGAIRIRSQRGRGTTIEVLLPFATNESTDDAKAPVKHEPKTQLEIGCVLVVDDGAAVRRMATEILHNYGVDVVCAQDGREALKVYEREKHRIDAVLLDVTMPEMDGHEAFARLRERSVQLPVVLSSGYGEHADHEWLQTDHYATFLKKPYTPDELAEALRQIC